MNNKPAPIPESCETCRYYQEYEHEVTDDIDDVENDPDDYSGLCRRYPPQVSIVYPAPIAAYPDVAATGWCGEFTPKL